MKKQQKSNYEAACQKMGWVPKPEPAKNASDGDVHDWFAHVLRVCVAAENAIEQKDGSFKEWRPKKDGTEIAYEAWFKKDSSGSGWSYRGYGNWYAHTSVGPRLEYRSLNILREAVVKLKTEYNNYFNS